MIQLAVSAYLAPVVRSHPSLQKCQGVLFQRALEAASSELQLRVLPNLLGLPLPGEGGFEVSTEERWDDPFEYVQIRLNAVALSGLDHAALGPIIANLIRIIASGNIQSRWRAILRLSHLYELKILTEEESKGFGVALWARLDESNLPTDNHALKTVSLLLPQPEPGLARERVKAYLLAQDFYRQARRHEGPDQGVAFGIAVGLQNLILEWCRATIQVPVKAQPASPHQIDWTADEAIILLEKTVAWWDEQKQFLDDAAGLPMISDGLRRDFAGVIDLLMKVILPRLRTETDKAVALAVRLVTELDDIGIVVLPVLPRFLFLQPGRYQEVATRIQAGLFSKEPAEIDGALLGLRDWIIYSREGDLPAPPGHFLDHFVGYVAGRLPIGIDRALMYLTDLLITVPEVVEAKHLEMILLGLQNLISETDGRVSAMAGDIETPDKPYVRIKAAKLARQLSRYYQDRSVTLPPIIEEWRIACENDPLAQVRRAWNA